MGKYSKSYSNYILRKRHQTTTDGSIFERDWGTLGERHVIESGKRKIYADSNFLFTDNNMRGIKSRNNTGEWSDAYTEDNLTQNVNSTPVNDISVLSKSNDIRDYAYFGSAVELIRSTITNIIKWFPARVWATEDGIIRYVNDGEYVYLDQIITDGHHSYAAKYVPQSSIIEGGANINMFAINNPFGVDLYSNNSTLTKDDNPQRFMTAFWKQYVVNGTRLTSWNVWRKVYDECDPDYTVIYDIRFTYNKNCYSTRPVDDDYCCIKFADSNVDCVTFAASDDCCYEEVVGHIYGLKLGSKIIWCTDTKGLVLQPEQTIITNYFNNLDGFESLLLSTNTNPKYTVPFITPIEMGDGVPGYYYVERNYTWPSIGYCICVDNIGFETYVASLYKMAGLMDSLWCDNIWRNMTHESIKNFDWTYTREYIDGDEVDNIEGGERMQSILRTMGRNYDNIKRYVDAIGYKNKVSFDGFSNIAPAELSDKCELHGWEVYSTKLNLDDNIKLGSEFTDTLTKLPDRWLGRPKVSHENWFNTQNPNDVNQNAVDNNFMRKLLLNSKGILNTKGTKQGIEEAFAMFGFGYNDFEISERFYSVVPKRADEIFYHYRVSSSYEIEHETFEDYTTPYITFENYLKDNHYEFNENSPMFIKFFNDFYTLDDTKTYEDFIVEFNELKNFAFNYEDDQYSGLPLQKVYIKNKWYFVPYFTQSKIYDGDVQFETNGGWGKFIESGDDVFEQGTKQYDYLETLPYTEVLQNVSELMNVNPYYIGGKRLYYVMDLTDITEFVEVVPDTLSHYFKLVKPNEPQLFASWKNVPTNPNNNNEDVYNQYCESNDLTIGVNFDDYKLTIYYDSLVMDNLGNNPHVGNGLYDLGRKYLDYIQEPFKYAAENYGFSNLQNCEVVKQLHFHVTEYNSEKVVNIINNPDEDSNLYYLPSKFLMITNKLVMNSEARNNFISYFKNVILKYIMQVIPSTSIFILKDF